MRVRKLFLVLLCLVLTISVIPVTLSESVVLDNDGKPRSNPYGKCAVKSSFDADYYDCYIPYNLTCKEVGGISVGGSGKMSESDMNKKVSAKINYEGNLEWSYSQNFLRNYAVGYTASYCEETDAAILTGNDGTQFYIAAIPYFCYASNMDGTAGFPGWSSENRGQLYDLILTDGTVLHFVVGDAKAQVHTNGGSNGYYVHNDLNYQQYRYLFQSYAGETVEIFGKNGGCVSKFMQKYGFGSDDGDVRVAYIRMYNKRLKDGNVVRAEGIPAGVGYTHDNVSISANSNSNGSTSITDENGNLIEIAIIPEYQLTGMPTNVSISDGGANVVLSDRDKLSFYELNSLSSSKDAIDARNSIKAFDFARHVMVFIGLLLLVYTIFVFLAAMFDRVNSFIDISLVSIFTFGALKVSNEKETKGQVGYASNAKLYVSIGVMTFVSVLLISGAVIPGIMKAVQSALDWLGDVF